MFYKGCYPHPLGSKGHSLLISLIGWSCADIGQNSLPFNEGEYCLHQQEYTVGGTGLACDLFGTLTNPAFLA